ncbi:rhodanese-like domain-containing protein [Gordonia alkanivorans]|uniref:sulfurtransferase n=1 Tax=Gordonia alkanivorans TaxID=84096 RepID=UPI001F4ED5FC|nr:rhodanese-like domain-containing protein [Gordonia alkanivorans]MDH3023365.1 rhodanese-like domain-containing protein [Gordonia alkanivorans]
MTPAPLITPNELQKCLGEGRLRIVDATVHLSFDADGAHVRSGRDTYLQGHLPGAVFLDQIAELSDPNGEAPFAAASSENFAAAVGAAGIGNDSTVVVYDTVNGIWATRLWWQFGLEGFDDVVVLDGGYDAWVAAGLPTETGESTHPAATFTAHRRPERIASTDEVVTATAESSVLLVNALDPTVRPVTYCGGGIAATAAAFALKALGRDDVAVYDGSMNAWTADPDRPLSSADSRS